METLREFLTRLGWAVSSIDADFFSYATLIIRFLLPALAILVVLRAIMSLLRERSEGEIWGQLRLENGSLLNLNYWENAIGRAGASDVYIEYPTISRSHAALNRDDKGNWRIYDVNSKAGVFVNRIKVDNNTEGFPIESGDHIGLGGVSYGLSLLTIPMSTNKL